MRANWPGRVGGVAKGAIPNSLVAGWQANPPGAGTNRKRPRRRLVGSAALRPRSGPPQAATPQTPALTANPRPLRRGIGRGVSCWV
jgi:hypothetical protein